MWHSSLWSNQQTKHNNYSSPTIQILESYQAPKYVSNHMLHTGYNIPTIPDLLNCFTIASRANNMDTQTRL